MRTQRVLFLFLVFVLFFYAEAPAANIAVLSNLYAAETAADFNSKLTGHSFTGIDVSSTTPTLAQLQAYDVVLLFEDGIFANATSVGNVVGQYAKSGHAVILGTFYEQDRSDAGGNGWGSLETIDPNTTDTVGCTYKANTINVSSIVPHPLTVDVTSLFDDDSGYSGGNQSKPDTIVLANWTNPNFLGNPDPAIAYRVTGLACVIHIGIAPQYSQYGILGVQYGGDFYQAWQNASDFAAARCVTATPKATAIPTLTEWGMLFFVVFAGLGSAYYLRRQKRI